MINRPRPGRSGQTPGPWDCPRVEIVHTVVQPTVDALPMRGPDRDRREVQAQHVVAPTGELSAEAADAAADVEYGCPGVRVDVLEKAVDLGVGHEAVYGPTLAVPGIPLVGTEAMQQRLHAASFGSSAEAEAAPFPEVGRRESR